MRGSSPFDVGAAMASFSLDDDEGDDNDENASPEAEADEDGDDEDDEDGRTIASTASSTHSRMRFFMSVLSAEPGRRLFSAQLLVSLRVSVSGARSLSAELLEPEPALSVVVESAF